MADIQGHRNPWHPDLLKLSVPQLDFILEMYAKDHPDEMKFSRTNQTKTTTVKAKWLDVLAGKALALFMHSQINMAVLTKRKKRQAETPQVGPRRRISGVAKRASDKPDG